MEIPSSQILMLIQQFLQENNLTESLTTLQQESKVYYKSTTFLNHFTTGNYLECLRDISTCSINPRILVDLYENIVMDWIEEGQVAGARMLLTQTEPMILLRESDSVRYLELEGRLTRIPTKSTELERSIKRMKIANSIRSQLADIPSNRLVKLLGQALKHQVETNQINPDDDTDLFTCQVPETRKEAEECVTRVYKTIEFKKSSMVECLSWSPDGTFFAVGLVDGFVEIYNHLTGKLRTDLVYQSKSENILLDSPCLTLSFSSDSKHLVTGGQDGGIYVWEVITGVLVKRMFGHGDGVCDVVFNKRGDQVLSGSFDFTAKIHGMKTGKTLKTFRGHTSYINTAVYSYSESQVLTGSSDGTIKIFSTSTTDCLNTISLSNGGIGIHTRPVIGLLKMGDEFVVCNQSGWIYFVNEEGKVLRSLEISKTHQFIACCVSFGDYIYLSTDKNVYCVSKSGDVVGEFVLKNEVIGMAFHPFGNILGLSDDSGLVSLYKP